MEVLLLLSWDVTFHVVNGALGFFMLSLAMSRGQDGQVVTVLCASSAERCWYSNVRSGARQLGQIAMLNVRIVTIATEVAYRT